MPESFEVELFHFGLPNHERYYPTLFPTLSSDSASVWEMLDNGAYWKEVIVAALLRVGYSGKAAWEIADNDKYAFDFYSDLIHCREKIYNYQQQRIFYVEMLGSVVAFCYKNFCRAWRGSVISRECLSTGSLDKMAGAGLEHIAPNLLLLLVLQEYPSDVPTLFPTFSAETALSECIEDNFNSNQRTPSS